jgi:hypothetical protein
VVVEKGSFDVKVRCGCDERGDVVWIEDVVGQALL